ncbi:hypothetical protein ACFO4O_16205 [Glaciecola siphonariae]|uniref:Uncharacterized protein n=1 Tax=Glaciecola siphonariae TaxID=521012 RepID=A0ABV9LZE5_9ALTE
MLEILNLFKFALLLIAFVLGISCIVMAIISDKSGQEALQERIEYGFMGVSGLVITLLMVYAIS